MNPYRYPLGIAAPEWPKLVKHAEAIPYSMLIATLLERGAPMTLDQVAERLEEVGYGERLATRKSLSRCKPARRPVWREGDRYGLEPTHPELDLWSFRLGLLPPIPERSARDRVARGITTISSEAVSLDQLRDRLSLFSLFEWHFLGERLIEELARPELQRILTGLIPPSDLTEGIPLADRLTRHVTETFEGRFRDELHHLAPSGHQTPSKTFAWLARTDHLLELGAGRVLAEPELVEPLNGLIDAVRAVDEEPNRFVAFEDDGAAALYLGQSLRVAMRALNALR